MRPHLGVWKVVTLSLAAGVLALVTALSVGGPADGPSVDPAVPEPGLDTREVSAAERADALARAQVWQAPKVPVARAFLGNDPAAPDELACRFKLGELGGTTQKFDCLLDTGHEVRIKYGLGAEIPGEAAATRLLAALGFGADAVTLIEHLRCYGCPKEPFLTMKAVEATRTTPLYERVIDHDDYEDFTWVAVERKFAASPIETATEEGWAFFELDRVDPSKGGAPREQVDALRLMAVVLAHWDNKASNQRLVCLSEEWPEGTRCRQPFLLLQDVGSTFGPERVDFEEWSRAAIWEDRATCTISMRDMPYEGATFPKSSRVTEGGRQFIGTLLGQLTDEQLTQLFDTARFSHRHGFSLFPHTAPVSEWVRAFKAKVQAIRDGPPCPEV